MSPVLSIISNIVTTKVIISIFIVSVILDVVAPIKYMHEKCESSKLDRFITHDKKYLLYKCIRFMINK
jgi:hypothetical protein